MLLAACETWEVEIWDEKRLDCVDDCMVSIRGRLRAGSLKSYSLVIGGKCGDAAVECRE